MIDLKYLQLLEKQNTLSLYIHIPFCTTKCYYCAFYSEDNKCWNAKDIDMYLDKLFKEIDLLKKFYNKNFDTVFIGGGNPGTLPLSLFRKLLIKIGPSRETTFEINPESLSSDYLTLFKEGLATRISIGIQSFDDNILKLLGRKARKEDNLKALEFCRDLDNLKLDLNDNYFIKNKLIDKITYIKLNTKIKYSFDLMSSLPTQSIKDSINDINILVENTKLTHLSLYCLTIEEGSYLYSLVNNKKINTNSDLYEKDMLKKLWDYLDTLDFKHYEISNFAKNGDICEHNLRYWKLKPYISLGSSSASSIYNCNKLIRLTNTSSYKEYINNNLLENYEIEKLNLNQFLDEYIIVSLRNKDGLAFDYLEEYFKLSKQTVISAFSKYDKSLYNINSDSISLTESGFIILDTIILEISLYFEDKITS